MPFGIIGRTGPGMRQVVGFGDSCMGRATFGGEFGVRHGDLTTYMCDSAATQPSSQISLGKLVTIIVIILCVCFQYPSYFIRVERFMPHVEIVYKHNAAARRLSIRGHNGKVCCNCRVTR